MLTLDKVKDSLPAASRNNMTQAMVDQLNNLAKDPEEARYMRENFISFSQVLQDGRFRLGDYVSAVMYVSHKVMNKSNLQAYKATFPTRHANMVSSGKATKDISSIVSAYNKGLLVTKVMELAIIPTWILNQDMFQSALQIQFELMHDLDVSDKVRQEAANSLLTHLKRPEVKHKHELKIEVAMSDGMAALENSIMELSQKQLDTIEHDPAVSAKNIAEGRMRDVTP